MSNPKFSVGDAVMIRCSVDPSINTDFTIITAIERANLHDPKTGRSIHDCYCYFVSHEIGEYEALHELFLRPIPPEKGLTWNECAWKPSNIGVVA